MRKEERRAGQDGIAQQVKAPATKPDNLSFFDPWTLMVTNGKYTYPRAHAQNSEIAKMPLPPSFKKDRVQSETPHICRLTNRFF